MACVENLARVFTMRITLAVFTCFLQDFTYFFFCNMRNSSKLNVYVPK